MKKFMCFLGLHKWAYTVGWLGHRYCTRCDKEQRI